MGQGKWSQEGDPMGPLPWALLWLYHITTRVMGEELLEVQASLAHYTGSWLG